ncbi:MAG: putative DNA-binding domain-containing protein [Gammaproteobacteria bacterium]|nr:putative DNA-binding domain-containing protein [Gammaproteobacteria bacterium]
MSALADLQSDFQSFLLSGGENMPGRVTGTAKVSAETRLAIYYDAYRLRLLEALASNYPVLRAWIGDEEFEKAGLAYLAAHPSRHFSIRYFGHRLPEFLAATGPWSDKPYIAEMASLEWVLSETFDAENGAVMGVEDMARIPVDAWPLMRLQLHPAVRRLDLRWNVPTIWKAVNQNTDAENSSDSCRGETSATPAAGKGHHGETAFTGVPPPQAGEYPRSWLIWRQDLRIYFRSLSVDEAWALDAARAGESFAAVCEGMCEWIDARNVALHAAGLMKQWITDGIVSEIILSGQYDTCQEKN